MNPQKQKQNYIDNLLDEPQSPHVQEDKNYFTEHVVEHKFMYHLPYTNYNLLVKLL